MSTELPIIRLVRYACGCIGFPPVPKPFEPAGRIALIVQSCDSSDVPPPSFFRRDVSGQDSTDLDVAETQTVLDRLTAAIAKAHAYDELRQTLTQFLKNG